MNTQVPEPTAEETSSPAGLNTEVPEPTTEEASSPAATAPVQYIEFKEIVNEFGWEYVSSANGHQACGPPGQTEVRHRNYMHNALRRAAEKGLIPGRKDDGPSRDWKWIIGSPEHLKAKEICDAYMKDPPPQKRKYTKRKAMIKITVQTIEGLSIHVDVSASARVRELKQIIANIQGPREVQHLNFGDTKIYDSKTLNHYGIEDGSTVSEIGRKRIQTDGEAAQSGISGHGQNDREPSAHADRVADPNPAEPQDSS